MSTYPSNKLFNRVVKKIRELIKTDYADLEIKCRVFHHPYEQWVFYGVTLKSEKFDYPVQMELYTDGFIMFEVRTGKDWSWYSGRNGRNTCTGLRTDDEVLDAIKKFLNRKRRGKSKNYHKPITPQRIPIAKEIIRRIEELEEFIADNNFDIGDFKDPGYSAINSDPRMTDKLEYVKSYYQWYLNRFDKDGGA